MSYTCPKCNSVSDNANRYCGVCHTFEDDQAVHDALSSVLPTPEAVLDSAARALGWSHEHLEVARQIKAAIDRARESAVVCLYPVSVWVNGEALLWPWPEMEWPVKGQIPEKTTP